MAQNVRGLVAGGGYGLFGLEQPVNHFLGDTQDLAGSADGGAPEHPVIAADLSVLADAMDLVQVVPQQVGPPGDAGFSLVGAGSNPDAFRDGKASVECFDGGCWFRDTD